MKKIRNILLALIILAALPVTKTQAQTIKLGGGLIIGTDLPPVGLQVKGVYDMGFILDNLYASANASFFIPASRNDYDYGRWSIDVDGHYVFYKAAGFNFYALSGLNITHYKKDPNFTYLSSDIGTSPGVNIGAGVLYDFSSSMSAYSEAKYIINVYDQSAITLGVLFNL